MATRMSLIALGAILLAGCAGQSSRPALSGDHPANPDAAAAPTRTPSMTLAVNEPVRSAPPAAVPGRQHEGHEGDGSGATSIPAATRKPAAAQPAAGQALYACPMHPNVVSTNPQDRCPECKMKIKKPVKQAAAPKAAPSAPAGENAGHNGEDGGH